MDVSQAGLPRLSRPTITVDPGTPAPPAPPALPASRLSTLTCVPTPAVGGAAVVGTVTLTAAGTADLVIALAADPGAIVPPAITVPAGTTSLTFPIATLGVAAPTDVVLAAFDGTIRLKTTLTLQPDEIVAPPGPGPTPVLAGLSVSPSTLTGGSAAQGTVTLESAVGVDTRVALTSSHPTLAAVPATVTVLAGQRSRTVPITTTVPASTTSVTLTATLSGLTRTALLSVQALAAPPPPPPPSTGAAHDYFEALATRADARAAYSLRDAVQLTTYSQQPQDAQYLYPNDPDPRQQDGAKIVIPSDGSGVKSETNRNSIKQVRFPFPVMEIGHSYLTVWDGWYGAEWDAHTSGLDAHKAFQFTAPKGPGFGNEAIWWEPSHRYRRATSGGAVLLLPRELARLSVRWYGLQMTIKNGNWIGVPAGPNVTSGSNSVTPILPYNEWRIAPETWTRYFQLIEYAADPDPWLQTYWDALPEAQTMPAPAWVSTPGTFMSLWAADETRAPFQIYNRLQVMCWPPGIGKFWIEFNTSQNEVKVGRPDLVAYVRNVNMNEVAYANVAALLVRPVR